VNWFDKNTFPPRPLVIIEDHVYHISELIKNMRQDFSDLTRNVTIVCLDRPGPDTDEAVGEWLDLNPELQVASRIDAENDFSELANRLFFLPKRVFQNQNEFCQTVAGFLRNGGLLLQDIELESLEFIPRDRWWETTYLASTVRGIFGDGSIHCAFFSNKRGYEATFGAELLAAGHDPRDVLNKLEPARIVLPFLENHLNKNFPWFMKWCESGSGLVPTETCRVSSEIKLQEEINDCMDVVCWPSINGTAKLCGRSVAGKQSCVQLPDTSKEVATWTALVEAALNGQPGVEVIEVGKYVAPAGALRPELTNAAARLIHTLRKRLLDGQDIVTVDGRYRFRDGLRVAIVSDR